ncbi:MAG: FMN-binding protein [Woeseia sp.]
MNIPGPVQHPPTSAWSMYRAIVGIGAIGALLIVAAYQITADRIRENRERYLARAISEVLPQARSTIAVAVTDDGRIAMATDAGALPLFLGFGADDELVGAVVSAEGMGYQDKIRVIYAYSFDLDAIVGFKVLDSKETPGLGDRVETEPHFLANFEHLDATLTPDGDALLHPIVTVKQGKKVEPWQLDGITGATITSEAIGNILNNSANDRLPVLERNSAALINRTTLEEQ